MVDGLAKADAALDRTGRKAQVTETRFERLQKSATGLRAAFAAIGAGIALQQFTRLLDVTTTIDNQIRLVTNSQEQLNAVYGELFAISQRTRTSLADNAEVFQKLAIATKDLGLTYREQLDLTERLNQTLIISGTNAQQGAAALRQLGQALASGALRGDEFISVSENIPKLLDVVVDELNRTSDGVTVTRGDLRELAKDGQITAELIVRAFKNAEGLDEDFAKITPTIQGAFTVFNNELVNFVRNVNAASGIGEIFARGILFLADNFNAVAGAAAGFAIIIGGILLKSVIALTVALAANPLGLLVVAIAAATAAIGAFGGMVVNVGGQTATVWQTVKAVVITVIELFQSGIGVFVKLWEVATKVTGGFFSKVGEWLGAIVGWFGDAFTFIGDIIKKAINLWIGYHVGLVSSIRPVIADGIPAVFNLAMGIAQNIVLRSLQNIVNLFFSGLGVVGDAIDYLPGIDGTGAAIRDALTLDLSGSIADVGALTDAVTAAGSNIASTFGEAVSTDYIGAVGDQVSNLATTFKDEFNTNLGEVIENQELSADLQGLLNQKFGEGVAPTNALADAAGAAGKATEDLNKKRQEFIDTIDEEFAKLQESQGGAVEQVRKWHAEQKMMLDSLGLAHTEYADKLEAIFQDRLAEAYKTDLANATDWRSGVQRAFMNLGESIGTEADLAETAITSLFDGATQAVVDFAEKGKVDFRAFAQSVAKDILQLTTKMLLFKAISGIAGGVGITLPGMATGGMVRGPGTGVSDSIPTMLSNGEFVVNADSTRQFRPLLEQINRGQVSMMNAGGLMGSNLNRSIQPAPVATGTDNAAPATPAQVNVIAQISNADVVAAINTPQGEQVVISMLERNRTKVRGVLNG